MILPIVAQCIWIIVGWGLSWPALTHLRELYWEPYGRFRTRYRRVLLRRLGAILAGWTLAEIALVTWMF